MNRLLTAAAALAMASPALAGSYRIVLDRPANGRLIAGHAGLQAADERTPTMFVRVIAPGNPVEQRGTVRVMVMNLGDRTFTFGPDQVTLRLGDGTVLKPVPVDQYEKRRVVAEDVQNRARTLDMRNRANLSALAGQTGGASVPVAGVQTMSTPDVAPTSGQESTSEDSQLPHAEVLNAIYQLLVPLDVEPQHAWGGYYVFDVPKDVQRRKVDQPLSIIVRTGSEDHVFSGILRWK